MASKGKSLQDPKLFLSDMPTEQVIQLLVGISVIILMILK